MTDGRERVRSVLSKIRIGIFLLSPSTGCTGGTLGSFHANDARTLTEMPLPSGIELDDDGYGDPTQKSR